MISDWRRKERVHTAYPLPNGLDIESIVWENFNDFESWIRHYLGEKGMSQRNKDIIQISGRPQIERIDTMFDIKRYFLSTPNRVALLQGRSKELLNLLTWYCSDESKKYQSLTLPLFDQIANQFHDEKNSHYQSQSTTASSLEYTRVYDSINEVLPRGSQSMTPHLDDPHHKANVLDWTTRKDLKDYTYIGNVLGYRDDIHLNSTVPPNGCEGYQSLHDSLITSGPIVSLAKCNERLNPTFMKSLRRAKPSITSQVMEATRDTADKQGEGKHTSYASLLKCRLHYNCPHWVKIMESTEMLDSPYVYYYIFSIGRHRTMANMVLKQLAFCEISNRKYYYRNRTL